MLFDCHLMVSPLAMLALRTIFHIFKQLTKHARKPNQVASTVIDDCRSRRYQRVELKLKSTRIFTLISSNPYSDSWFTVFDRTNQRVSQGPWQNWTRWGSPEGLSHCPTCMAA